MCSTCGSDGVSHELKNDKSGEKCVDWHCTFIKWKSMDKSKGVLVLVNPLFLKKNIKAGNSGGMGFYEIFL